jgi:hypothetical protein
MFLFALILLQKHIIGLWCVRKCNQQATITLYVIQILEANSFVFCQFVNILGQTTCYNWFYYDVGFCFCGSNLHDVSWEVHN